MTLTVEELQSMSREELEDFCDKVNDAEYEETVKLLLDDIRKHRDQTHQLIQKFEKMRNPEESKFVV